jgi:hypothetical protein
MDKLRLIFLLVVMRALPAGADTAAALHFHQQIEPLLNEYCFDCHADGANKGGIAFDEFKSDQSVLTNHTLWLAVLKNVRSGLMPPPKKSRPTAAEQTRLVDWIKYGDFGIDPAHPNPGRVTVRRLNRFEYRNTIRDLIGVDYDTTTEFPPDDTGYGFDDIGDVLTLSPMLLEKYLDAAENIITAAVPVVSHVMAEKTIDGYAISEHSLSYYRAMTVTNILHVKQAGHYELTWNLKAHEKFVDDQFDYNRCRVIFREDGHEFRREEYGREDNKALHYDFNVDWPAGPHEVTIEVQPLTPGKEQVRSLGIRIDSLTMRGPTEEKYWEPAPNYARFFPGTGPSSDTKARRAYAGQLLRQFASRAFRRPVDEETLSRLVALAENTYNQSGKTFEAGVAHAMVAVLASPQFLFREEGVELGDSSGTGSLIDEYALASRLSYFLWSSMPDDELFRLAADGKLRENLPAQVKRMEADPRFKAFVQNFTGQWLQARDIETIPIEARAVLEREEKPDPDAERKKHRYHELENKPEKDLSASETQELKDLRYGFYKAYKETPRAEMSDDLRHDMRRETDLYFAGIVREDRSVTELVDSDYTYLNETLARFYGLTNLNVAGSDMRKVTLPADCPRGGVLTMGTVLAVTSNPTRTSPVKRGLFILENILGDPTPPPPPNIPPLEDAEKNLAGREPTLREVLEIHRSQPMCNSCHGRMDPIGLGFENFNAMGMWRTEEHGSPIDVSGKLITGESFQTVRQLKHILMTDHRDEFYRTLTEKLLTYALGRGLEYYDVETVDQIVTRLQRENGRFSALLNGIIESAPFQKRQSSSLLAESETAKTALK